VGRPVELVSFEYAPYAGGIAVYTEELAQALVRLGWAVRLWVPSYGKPQGETEENGVRVLRVAMRAREDYFCQRRMATAMRLVVGETGFSQVLLLDPGSIRMWLRARSLRVPQAKWMGVVFHGSDLQKLSARPAGQQRLREFLESVNRVGGVSEAVCRQILKVYPGVQKRLVGCPGAVRAAFRREPWEAMPAGAGEGRLRLIQVGRWHPRKGQDILLEAMGRLSPGEQSKIRLDFSGTVVRRSYVRRLEAAARQLRCEVNFHEGLETPALAGLLRQADVLAMPSRRLGHSLEGLGLASLEGAWFGCALLVARTGGADEVLEDGSGGIVFPEGDVDALAHSLRELLSMERSDLVRMGQRAHQYVEQKYSWEGSARNLLGERR
jgi:phosphatidylinositol alpha-1,6-mannosyltransferase